jgi:L-aminoadipate-semialdehyde dehydrogenase
MILTMDVLRELGIEPSNSGAYCGEWIDTAGDVLGSTNPATGESIASVREAGAADYERVSAAASETFLRWREVPAPQRGEYVRLIGEEMRRKKEALSRLVTMEMGKILEEARGEVQECIDIADFALGLSRQLYGLTIQSERPQHSMRETWHPLGTVGIITAFNFPVAVWAWNAMLSLVCGDANIWKPSRKTPLTALALTRIAAGVLEPAGFGALVGLVIGPDETVGSALLDDPKIPLVSATGSTRMGRVVGQRVAGRLGRTLLELGGNNAIIVWNDADIDMAVRAIVFGAIGTAGQRCTSTRRVLAHEDIIDELQARLVQAYSQVSAGDPMDEGTLLGPVIDRDSVDQFIAAVGTARDQGAELVCGGGELKLDGALAAGAFAQPTIMRAGGDLPLMQDETFAPLLYLVTIGSIDDAIRIHNEVPQGLSSAIFTMNVRLAERFLSAIGSDCGIANVNIGTSGAEIGGAFGGEKDTGGGRESGSDAWKNYMRRQTSTVNWGADLPLAQGIKFGDES